MYGWRGRIGIIIPADNGVLEPDFYRLAPDGVSTHVARLCKSPRAEYPAQAIQLAESSLRHTRVNIVGHMCAASSFLLGPKGNEEFCDQLTKASGGLPSFTASTSMVAALSSLEARTISVISPHIPEIAQYLTDYLKASGFTVRELVALGLGAGVELGAINDTSPEQIYKIARKLDMTGVDALFIAATNFRAVDVIETIEADIGRPVITSNQAGMWVALGLLGVSAVPSGFGSLFKGPTYKSP